MSVVEGLVCLTALAFAVATLAALGLGFHYLGRYGLRRLAHKLE